jgi:hypothetical protein
MNIDEDPINANWLRWRGWKVGLQDLSQLVSALGLENASRDIQVEQLMRLNRYYVDAPELLNLQLREFLSGVPLDQTTKELKD